MCAVLHDEENCKANADHLELYAGDQGVLPLLSRGLRRNDVEVCSGSWLQVVIIMDYHFSH